MRYPLSGTGTTGSRHTGFLFVNIKTDGTLIKLSGSSDGGEQLDLDDIKHTWKLVSNFYKMKKKKPCMK